jgi:predicted dehydrogenase
VFAEINQLPGVEIVGASSGCSDNLSGVLSQCKAVGAEPAVYDDHIKMLDELKPDAVVINGPFNLHARMCIEAMERGINVLCEKPVALTLEDLGRIETAYHKTNGLLLMSMVGLRYEPCFMTAWKAVKEGAVGKVKLIHTQKSYKLGTRPDFYKSRKTYGGTIPWVGSHALDWIYWFSGSEFDSVLASHTAEDNYGNGDLEIAAQCQVMMKNGVQASASIDYLRPLSAVTHGDDRVRVAGTQGVIEVLGGKVTLIDSEGLRELLPTADVGVFSDFSNHVQGRSKALVSTEDTFVLTRACLLARESADTEKLICF